MAADLEVFLIGNVNLKLKGAQLTALTSPKATALLIYLVCHPGPVSREVLADLFYGHLPQKRARANLSVLLNRLCPLSAHLIATRQSIAFNLQSSFWLDVKAFEARVIPSIRVNHDDDPPMPDTVTQLEAALALYRGDFLTGFHTPEALGFEEWMVLERERLHRLAVHGAEKLVDYYVATNQLQAGREAAGRLLQLDPLHEAAHRQLMTLLARSGLRSEALAHYEICRQTLETELGVEPSPATMALYNCLRRSPPPALHNLPTPTTAFVGRDRELGQLAEQLATPTCRLVTLLGPGGTGKTRLATEFARQYAADFADGIYFIRLGAVDSLERLVMAIASTFGGPAYNSTACKSQLLYHLQDKELLLVLDRYEHLLTPLAGPEVKGESASSSGVSGATTLLIEILATAPSVKILVTSCTRLHLQDEWVIPVRGLSLPASVAPADLAASSAVQLFIERGRHVRPGFDLSVKEGLAVVRLCHLLDGLPLAIELAASWLHVLSCAEITAEIEQNLDFLHTTRRDLPPRQRSIRAVLDHAWRLLTDVERWGVRQLAIFQGGFRREAALAVLGGARAERSPDDDNETGTSARSPQCLSSGDVLDLLSALVDKSLLQVTCSGRYEQHPLLHHFAMEKLAAHPADLSQAQARHGHFFAALTKRRLAAPEGQLQLAVFTEIDEEFENIESAWHWAVEQQHLADLEQCLQSLQMYLSYSQGALVESKCTKF